MITLYGIRNCDTVKKARRWLDNHRVDYHYHDFREDGLRQDDVAAWLDKLGWETLINKRSASWKALDTQQRDDMDDKTALSAILLQPTLIKRPLLDTGDELETGFGAAQYERIFRKHAL